MRSLSIARIRADEVYGWPNSSPPWQAQYFSTSLLSAIWHSWCHFCRELVLLSCSGTTSRGGVVIPPRNGLNDWQRVAYEVNQLRRGRAVSLNGSVRVMREEPTWGDVDVLIRAVPGLGLANQSSLMSGFGLATAAKHIQLVRNACAHLNSETMSDVRSILPFYSGGRISHPSDVMWMLNSAGTTDVVFIWLEELEVVADILTR